MATTSQLSYIPRRCRIPAEIEHDIIFKVQPYTCNRVSIMMDGEESIPIKSGLAPPQDDVREQEPRNGGGKLFSRDSEKQSDLENFDLPDTNNIRDDIKKTSKKSSNIRSKVNEASASAEPTTSSNPTNFSRFLSFHFHGSIESGHFEAVNDVYIKYSIVAGPDWLLTSGTDVGITQISRYSIHKASPDSRRFVWNQPVSISYRSYNFFGWPQIVMSVYYFDTFGNDQILGYGAAHLPVSCCALKKSTQQQVNIYAPQSSSVAKQILCWLTGRRPELIDSTLFARPDCRRVLQVNKIGHIKIIFNLTSKDVASNGYLS